MRVPFPNLFSERLCVDLGHLAVGYGRVGAGDFFCLPPLGVSPRGSTGKYKKDPPGYAVFPPGGMVKEK